MIGEEEKPSIGSSYGSLSGMVSDGFRGTSLIQRCTIRGRCVSTELRQRVFPLRLNHSTLGRVSFL